MDHEFLDRIANKLAYDADWAEAENLQRLEDEFLTNSEPYFASLLSDLIEKNQVQLKSYKIRIRQEPGLQALAYPKKHWFGNKTFDIVVTQGLYNFLFQLSRIYHFTGIVQTVNGRIVELPTVTYGRALSLSAKAVFDYVMLKQGSVSVDFPWLLELQRAVDAKQPVIRRNYTFGMSYQQSMTLFILAHEIGHIIKKHRDRPVARTSQELWDREYEADEVAVDLYARWVKGREMSTADPNNSAEFLRARQRHWKSGAMGGAAFAFAAWDLAESFAKELNQNWSQSHPPSSDRYQRFKASAPLAFGVESEFFQDGEYFGPSPSQPLALFNTLASHIRSRGTLEGFRNLDEIWSKFNLTWQDQKTPSKGLLDNLRTQQAQATKCLSLGLNPLIDAQISHDIGAAAISTDQLLDAVSPLREAAEKAQNSLSGEFSERLDASRIRSSSMEALAFVELKKGEIPNAVSAIGAALKEWKSLAEQGNLWTSDTLLRSGDLVHDILGKTNTEDGVVLLRLQWQAIVAVLKMADDLSEETSFLLSDMKARTELFSQMIGFDLDKPAN